jgi:predicted AAA+ superfamily ATPase
MLIKRQNYLDSLWDLKDRNFVKVATGIRRVGKSTIMQMFAQRLMDEGVDPKAIQSFNFEKPELALIKDWSKINKMIESDLVPNTRNYIFLDEVQNLPEFQHLILGLFTRSDVDLYVTGSNSYLLSGQLATLLAGRYLQLHILPISFKEYHDLFKDETEITDQEKLDRYLKWGGFPEVVNFIYDGLTRQVPDYFNMIYQTVVENDIRSRFKFSTNGVFSEVLRFALDSVGSLISPNNIRNTINSDRKYERPISLERIENYLAAFTHSYVLDKVERYDLKGKNILKTLNKFYCVDTGLRNSITDNESPDSGHLLENLVYTELIRRGYTVRIGKYYDKEIDFVAKNPDGYTEYYQATNTMVAEDTRRREITPLESINDHNPKYIITRDYGESSYNGIKQINAVDWLLGRSASQ